MKHIILTLIFACVGSLAWGQTLEWAKGIGGINYEAGNSIITDALGNVYTTGFFQGTCDFDPGAGTFNLTSAGGNDIFIAKLDLAGNFVWATKIGGTGLDRGNAIKLDASGNIYITGYFQFTVDFDPNINNFNLISAGGNEIFIAKFDGAGNFIWAKRLGGALSESGNALALDSQGNVYTTGIFSGQADFDPSANNFSLVSTGLNDIFISKLDSTGNFVWAKKIGGNADDNGYSLALDTQGKVYITGSFTNGVDFDPNAGIYNLYSMGMSDIFITTLDTAGNLVWAKNMGGSDYDYGYSIALDIQGNVYTTGTFKGTADFDPGNGIYNPSSQGIKDIFVSKLDSSGNFIWAKTMGGTADDIGSSIALDIQGNVYTTGYFQSTVDFDPNLGVFTLTSAGVQDIFISKLDTSGNFFWTKAMGGIGQDQGNALTIGAMGYLFTTGLFENIADFDPSNGIYNLNSVGDKDIFVQKMLNCLLSYDTLTITACDSYTANGQTFTISGNYSQTIINALGCDSILTVNLTINHTTYASLIQMGCDTLILNGQSYTSSGTYTQILINTLGCDSILTLYATINHSTDSIINQIACDTFAFNGQTYTYSGIYPHYFTNSNNCDSIVYLNLTISNTGNDTLIETACQYYILNGQTYTASGIYSQIVPGCDSAITLILTINTTTYSTINQTSCYSYTLNGQTYTTSGIYLQTFTNGMGCDSLLSLNLTINNSTDSTINEIACNYFTLNGQTYTTTGTYSQILTNFVGCDSILTINLIINDTTYETLTQNGCDSIVINGQTYTTSGTYTQTFTNFVGCDSILTLNLTIHSPTFDTTNQTACGAYTINGQTFTTSGSYTVMLINVNGCDSILTLNLAINPSQSYSWTDSGCDVYFTPFGTAFTSSGTYVEYEPNNWGCLDTVTYILTINPTVQYSWTGYGCESYDCNGVVYTQGGDWCYYEIGCNQYQVWIYIHYPEYASDGSVTSCGSYTINGDTYYTSGSYLSHVVPGDPSWGECPTYYYTDVTIVDSIDVSVSQNSGSLTANTNVQDCYFQWIDCNSNTPIIGATSQTFTPTSNGFYAVIATQNSCTDTSVCYLVTNASIETNSLQNQIQAYPNPTNGILILDLGNVYEDIEVKVSDLVGKELSTTSYEHGEVLEVEMPVVSGVYFVSVKFKDGETVTVKVVRE